MDHPNSRSAINDPNQCRLCMRVCDDNFLECIFSDKEYSIAHQIFECTSIRVTKQDNLTKICKNCASLLFLTTEFRNTCFKTNRLLMEDFVILELGDWASDGNRLLLRECENFIVRHKQQVDYLYTSIVSEGEQYLEGSLEIERELFGNDGQQQQQQQQQHQQQEPQQLQEQTDKNSASGRVAGHQARLEPECEPDPEILMEITKFLEEQTPRQPDSQLDHTEREHVLDLNRRCGLCCILSEVTFELTSEQFKLLAVLNFDNPKHSILRGCEECCMVLDIIEHFQSTTCIAQGLSGQQQSALQTLHFESILEQAKAMIEKFKHKNEAFARLQPNGASPEASSFTLSQTESKNVPKKAYKRAKVTCHICGKQYDNWKLQTHLNEHENIRPYVCDQEGCSSTFAGLVLLNRHKKLWHTDYFYAVCNVCGKKCKTQGIYKTHLSYHEEPKLPCTVCGKLMRNKRAIWKHMKTHSNDRKHVCGVCNKKFTIAYTLRVHMRIHTNDKPYPCGECDKRFQYKCLLKNHYQRYHCGTDTELRKD
uniref:Protein krueppel n=1 Tax=Anopheles christyi TaxID=43041 RepID=A0A182K2Y5_9DIPT